MKLSDYKNTYYELSGSASNVARQIAFAGIALIWIFKKDSSTGLSLPNELLWPTMLLISGLTADLLQYISASVVWGVFHRVKEIKGHKSDDQLDAPLVLNWPALFFFWIKLFLITGGNIAIISYAAKSIAFQ
ncbi:hypothetical protein [Stutzerimonas stutzeri]|uniref:hypothetical protein n=1 Tax=Stutzerimonas stutzeri TaxID=316 RepID=UPI0021FF270F|nr:hypothetical protein [Stutzerimonas stutzeri]UVO16793.1 hypothetical protein KN217_12920 [Stutzerimonas stutzeri]